MIDSRNVEHKFDGRSYFATIARLARELKAIAWPIIIVCLVCVCGIVISILAPEALGQLVDVFYNYDPSVGIDIVADILPLVLQLALAYGGVALTSVIMAVMLTRVTTGHFTYGLRKALSLKLSKLSVEFCDTTQTGEILSRVMGDVSNMTTTIHVVVQLVISGVLRLIIYSIMMYMIEPIMATVIIVMTPISIAVGALISMRSEKAWAVFRRSSGRMNAFVEENYSGYDTIKAFNLEDMQASKTAGIMDEYAGKMVMGYYIGGLVQPVVSLFNNITFIITCLLGGMFVVNGTLAVGDVLMIIVYAKMFSAPIESIANGMSEINHAVACARRVYELLDEPSMTSFDNGQEIEGDGVVDIQNVYFSYVEDKPLIRDLNLHVEAGQKIAIVGPTGGGKTTIVNLLMRFYDVNSGTITIDGVDISQIHKSKLRAQFGMVLQDTWLFGGSVYDNIAYGKEGATREEVMFAAEQAHIDTFIESLPNGYDTIINEESTNISGGQKQLLTIARAYLANRKMLILDEATSNVDTRTELLIQKTMDELMKGRTSFVIAHRLSTIVNADVILVVRDGQVVEQGTHKQLLEDKGFYYELYNAQYEQLK